MGAFVFARRSKYQINDSQSFLLWCFGNEDILGRVWKTQCLIDLETNYVVHAKTLEQMMLYSCLNCIKLVVARVCTRTQRVLTIAQPTFFVLVLDTR
jgi:hypothetical protein